MVRFGNSRSFRFIDPMIPIRERLRNQQPTPQQHGQFNGGGPELNTTANYVHYGPGQQQQRQPQQPQVRLVIPLG